jgi:glycosyltransferase involved in cell wall biosynthesis
MAAGIPVIATKIVNEGIGAKEDEEIIIADTPDEYIKQISKLFIDEALRRKIGLAGKNFVLNKFSWDIVLQRINTLKGYLENR